MTDLRSNSYRFTFTGDAVECFIAQIPQEKAEEWLNRGGEALFRDCYASDDDDETAQDASHIGRASDLPGVEHLEGCELRHGILVIEDADGDTVAEYDLEDEDFQNFVDDVQEIDPETHLINGSATLITRCSYSGSVSYKTEAFKASFDEAGWYVSLSDMGGEPFISTLNFENETLEPEGSGSFGMQELWLNVPDSDGKIRQIYHSVHP